MAGCAAAVVHVCHTLCLSTLPGRRLLHGSKAVHQPTLNTCSVEYVNSKDLGLFLRRSCSGQLHTLLPDAQLLCAGVCGPMSQGTSSCQRAGAVSLAGGVAVVLAHQLQS